ncbi:hypothetical protein [Helicobacter sp. 11S02629-2]|uniref:hypothetical protein n=1 Tax=Helicobacter sp. 11S02629-2 TaxID=1476195 RepID=UPI000BA68DD2|nr:hypothetical protein [Helicobacter sp. 11S02629-2]PAF45378.1 hypothetical protein BKH40_04100 [Helicobacter sp. 11S02629-2]
MLVNTKTLASLLSLTDRHVYNLEKAGVLSKEEKDAWDVKKCFSAYLNYKINLENITGDMGKIKLKRELAEARLKELAFKVQTKKLVDIDTVSNTWSDISNVVTHKLYDLPVIRIS